VEMLARVRDLLRDGTVLAVDSRFPVYLVEDGFRYLEDGLLLSVPVTEESSNMFTENPEVGHQQSSLSIPPTVPENSGIHRPPSVAISDSHQSMSTEMYQMVDRLVTPSVSQGLENSGTSDETSYGMHTATARDIFGLPVITHPEELPRASLFPSFPSLPGQDSAFSPHPGELHSPNFERPSTATRLAALQFRENSSGASSPLVSGNDRLRNCTVRNVWGVGIAPYTSSPLLPAEHNIGLQIQQSLEQEYLPSSGFSHSSSIYQGTPQFGAPNIGRPVTSYGLNESQNASTNYGDPSDYDRMAQLQSSIWNGTQSARRVPFGTTPPGGQGG